MKSDESKESIFFTDSLKKGSRSSVQIVKCR